MVEQDATQQAAEREVAGVSPVMDQIVILNDRVIQYRTKLVVAGQKDKYDYINLKPEDPGLGDLLAKSPKLVQDIAAIVWAEGATWL